MEAIVKPTRKIKALFSVEGDKSISHRAIMLSSIANGDSHITGFLKGADCLSTISCFRAMGIEIEEKENEIIVHGKGIRGLKKPEGALDVGNSGTTIRLLSGILAAQDFSSELNGDESINKRPMKRILTPLSQMGAKISARDENYTPLKIEGGSLNAIEYEMPVASAQVKSSILLASLYADGETRIIEPMPSRNHTEIMLNYLGANVKNENGVITSQRVDELKARNIFVPGDISSAAYFMVAGLIVPDSEIIITNVGVNPTRTGIIDALKEMGGRIEVVNERHCCGEKIADIRVRTSQLHGITLSGDIIPRMIDEIPVFAVAALYAKGQTIIRDAQELKVKESNRIKTIKEEFEKMGADITETDDGMIIEGALYLKGTKVQSHNDHRIAMSLAVAALGAVKPTTIENAECVDISFPSFFELINKL